MVTVIVAKSVPFIVAIHSHRQDSTPDVSQTRVCETWVTEAIKDDFVLSFRIAHCQTPLSVTHNFA
jgi:hypothetical protein